jgi:L-alanine-DL-glutamate epimerase-like enolase superfamily enzyme
MMESIQLNSIKVSVYRMPIDTPVQTSFGLLKDRASVVLQVTDENGDTGLGEVWCNFPTVGAEHRARLLSETIAPLALANRWASVAECHRALTQAVHILALQAGEPGPISQVLAGLNIALWDLVAKREGLPLWQILGGTSNSVSVYASGLNPTNPESLALTKAAEGHTRFKLKVGFSDDLDIRNIASLRTELGPLATLMIDANQAWNVDHAISMSKRLSKFGLRWLEEPIAVDQPIEAWKLLALQSPIPLAAGENFRDGDFARYLEAGVVKVIQPDVAKWGGFTDCLPLGSLAADTSTWLCPHWLGAGIGLLATLHLKAAIGGPGFAEIDANPNPLRELLAGPLPAVRDGALTLNNLPGLGAQPNFTDMAGYLVTSSIVHRNSFK